MFCSLYLWFVKYFFSAKIWFVKTSTWIVKYESRVVKSNPGRAGSICFIRPSCYDASVKKDRHIKNYCDQPGRLLISFDFSYIELLDNWRTLWSAMDWVIEGNLCNTEINHKHDNKKKMFHWHWKKQMSSKPTNWNWHISRHRDNTRKKIQTV